MKVAVIIYPIKNPPLFGKNAQLHKKVVYAQYSSMTKHILYHRTVNTLHRYICNTRPKKYAHLKLSATSPHGYSTVSTINHFYAGTLFI